MRPPRATPLVCGVLVALVSLSGCSSQSATPPQSPRQVLDAAKQKLDRTSGVQIRLAVTNLPNGTSGLVAARGVGTHAPAFQGTIKVSAAGVTADVAVVALKGVVYAQLPFTTSFSQINPADYSAPDPAALLSEQGGLSSLLTSTTGLTEGKQTRQGEQVLTSYRGTVPGKAVSTVLPSAAAGKPFQATYDVDSDGRLSQAVITGPFYPQAPKVTYTISFDRYGVRPQIKAPASTKQ